MNTTETKLSGGASTAAALQYALDELSGRPSQDHDFVVMAYGVTVTDVAFMEPDTLLLTGVNEDGFDVVVLAHFTQLITHVVMRPKKGDAPVKTKISGCIPSQK